jgi:tungstate transport system ATP-binding protein
MYRRARRGLSYLPQEASIFRKLTVEENLMAIMQTIGIQRQERKSRCRQLLEELSIAHLARSKGYNLSGGERRRTEIARTLVTNPHFILLDEPFAALDVPTRQALFGDMVNILQETNFTTVMVTHDRNEARTLAHRITVLMNGGVVQEGTPRDIFSSPVNEEMARFVGVENVLEGTVSSNKNTVTDINVQGQIVEGVSNCEPGRAVYVCIRPEDVTISLSQSLTSARNVFSGKITSMISSDPLVRLNLDCGFLLLALITRMSCDGLKLEVGKTVYASFKATAIHIIKRN